MDNQQGPTIKYMEFCSMLWGSLDGRGVWGRMDTCVFTVESLSCSPETNCSCSPIMMLLISYTPIENKKFKLKQNKQTTKKNRAGLPALSTPTSNRGPTPLVLRDRVPVQPGSLSGLTGHGSELALLTAVSRPSGLGLKSRYLSRSPAPSLEWSTPP